VGCRAQSWCVAVEYIQDQLDADLTVSGIAQAVSISRCWFTRLFKESTGQTPHQYVVEARVRKSEGTSDNRQIHHQRSCTPCRFCRSEPSYTSFQTTFSGYLPRDCLSRRGCRFQLIRDRYETSGAFLTIAFRAMFGLASEERSQNSVHYNGKMAPRGWSHHDDAIGYPEPSRFAARPKMWVCKLADGKRILGRLQEIVVCEQLQRHCQAARPVSRLSSSAPPEGSSAIGVLIRYLAGSACEAPRFDGCSHCGERRITSPVSELLSGRVSPELRHLQATLAAQLPLSSGPAALFRGSLAGS